MRAPLWSLLLVVIVDLVGCTSARPEKIFRDRLAATADPARERLKDARCEVYRDPAGLFHARGADELVTYACLGLLHGKFRGFQADYFRRLAQGRLGEILGTSKYKSDFFLRTLALPAQGERLLAALPPRDRELLDAYAHGMNEGLALALEAGQYELVKLGYVPEPWRPVDTVAVIFLKSFNETQRSLWQKLRESEQGRRFGKAAEKLYARDGLPWDVTILKHGEFPRTAAAARAVEAAPLDMPAFTSPTTIEGTGSNSWVLSPRRSRGGHAWLANDPHLELTHPPFWFWVHLSASDASALDAVGGTIPGVPLMPSGFNRHVSWGITDSYLDAGDIVAVPETDTEKFTSERPTIRVKLGFLTVPVKWKSVRRSPEGWPVLPIDGPPGKALVVRWTGYLLGADAFSGFSRILTAKSVKELDTSFSRVQLPSWNFVFADARGDIGYRAEGLVLRRTAPEPRGVQPLAASALALPRDGLLSPEEMPQLRNPARGYIATANNRHWPAGARFDGGRAYPQGMRAFRVEELIAAREKHDFESIAAIQCDTQAVDARFLLPRLLAAAEKATRPEVWRPAEAEALESLRRWDFVMAGECRACSTYRRWVERVQARLGLDVGALYRALGEPRYAGLAGALTEELAAALTDLKVGPGRPVQTWIELQRAFFPHVTGAREFATNEWISTPGDEFSVNPAKSDWKIDHYEQRAGAAHRLIVEMTSPPRGRFALSGANEDPEEKAVKAQDGPWTRWRDCRYADVEFPIEWSKVPLTTISFSSQ